MENFIFYAVDLHLLLPANIFFKLMVVCIITLTVSRYTTTNNNKKMLFSLQSFMVSKGVFRTLSKI